MNTYIEFSQSHPLYEKIEKFFSTKKGWTIVSKGFGTDYVVCLETVFPKMSYVETDRIFIATQFLSARIDDVKEGKLECFAFIDLLKQEVYLPTGDLVSWHVLVTEHCIALDEVL